MEMIVTNSFCVTGLSTLRGDVVTRVTFS